MKVKYRLVVPITMAVLLLFMQVSLSCSTKQDEKANTISSPEKPAATPTANTTTSEDLAKPAATPAPAIKPPSWGDSNVFTSATYGINLKYPKTWQQLYAPDDNNLVALASATQLVSDRLDFHAVDETTDIDSTLKAHLLSIWPIFKVTILSSKKTVLSDGKTPATEVVMHQIFRTADVEMPDFYAYALAMAKDGKIIFACAMTNGGESREALIREIVSTFAVK